MQHRRHPPALSYRSGTEVPLSGPPAAQAPTMNGRPARQAGTLSAARSSSREMVPLPSASKCLNARSMFSCRQQAQQAQQRWGTA